jgi:hypothetical protein
MSLSENVAALKYVLDTARASFYSKLVMIHLLSSLE